MKRIMVVTAAILFVAVYASMATAVAYVKKPVTCQISAPLVQSLTVSVKAGCKAGTTPIAVKQARHDATVLDAVGNICATGQSKGTGLRAPIRLAGAALMKGSFTVSVPATTAHTAVTKSRSFSVKIGDGTTFCGDSALTGPSIQTVQFSAPNCTSVNSDGSNWFKNGRLKIDTLGCYNMGTCKIVPAYVKSVQGYGLTIYGGRIACSKGYSTDVSIGIYKTNADGSTCGPTIYGLTAFRIPSSWGGGAVKIWVDLTTTKGQQQVNVNHFGPYSYTLNGPTDICSLQ